MQSPFTGKKISIHQEWRTLSFRKDEFEILSHTYKCDKTGEKFEDDLFAKLNYNQLLNQQRAKYSIPFPEEIISIRKKYDVSALKRIFYLKPVCQIFIQVIEFRVSRNLLKW